MKKSLFFHNEFDTTINIIACLQLGLDNSSVSFFMDRFHKQHRTQQEGNRNQDKIA